MRIVILTQDFPPCVGGTAEFVHQLASALHRHGSEVSVLAPGPRNGTDENQSYRVERYSRPRRFAAIGTAQAFSRAVRRYRPEIVFLGHLMTTHALSPLLCRRLLGLPYVILIHGTDLRYCLTRSTVDALIGRRILFSALSVMVNSDHTRNRLLSCGYPAERVSVVHPGVDAALFNQQVDPGEVRRKQKLDGRPIVITVSRLAQRKGHAAVIRALPAVMEKIGPVVYVIVGRGPEEGRLRALVRECGLDAHVRFVGYVGRGELPAYYRAADLFVMPAEELGPEDSGDVEGFGIAFCEAASCGLPAIGSRTGGIPEAVIDGVTGILVDPGNVPQLAEAMTRLLADRSLALEMGRRGLERVREELTWERTGRQVGEHLEHLLKTERMARKGWW